MSKGSYEVRESQTGRRLPACESKLYKSDYNAIRQPKFKLVIRTDGAQFNIKMKNLATAIFLSFIISLNVSAQDRFDPSRSGTTTGLTFTNITLHTPTCFLISGSSHFGNNFFLDSCISKLDLKETSSVGYVHDTIFLSPTSGWMINGGSIVEMKEKKLIEAAVKKEENYGFTTINFVNSKLGWAPGDDGKLAETRDGGKKWTIRKISDFDLTNIFYSDKNNLWSKGFKFASSPVRYEHLLMRSTDSGTTWNVVKQTAGKELIAMKFFDEKNGVALTSNGEIEETTDAGGTWTEKSHEKHKFSTFDFLDKNTGWAIDDGKLYFTMDAGTSWKKKADLPPNFP